MKKSGHTSLNRSHQFSATDISLLIIAAFCSLVVVFIGYHCCKHKKPRKKKKAQQRKISKRGNHHDETGDLLNTASQVSSKDLELEDWDVDAPSCSSFEEKPKRNTKQSTSSPQRSNSPSFLRRIMSSLGSCGRGSEDSKGTGENESMTASSSKKHKSENLKQKTKDSQVITKQPEASGHTETHNHIKDGRPKSNTSINNGSKKTTRDDPLTKSSQSAQLAGNGKNKSGGKKGGNKYSLNGSRNPDRSHDDCTGNKCEKCNAFEDDHKGGKARDAGKPVEASSKLGTRVDKSRTVKHISSLDDELTETGPHVKYESFTYDDEEIRGGGGMDVEEDSVMDSTEDQMHHRSEGTERDTRGSDSWGSERDTRGSMGDTRGKERDTSGKEGDTRGKDTRGKYTSGTERDTGGTERDTRGTDWDNKERNSRGSEKDTRGTERDTRGKERDTRGKEKDTKGAVWAMERDTRGRGKDTKETERDTRGRKDFKDQPTREEASLAQHRDMDVTIGRRLESVGDVYNVMQYARNEWKSDTATAKAVREGYFQIPVQLGLNNLRVIRGDNYCAIRATLFQALAKKIPILSEPASVEQIPQGLMASGFRWIQDWNFGSRFVVERPNVCEKMRDCLQELAELVALNAQMDNEEGRVSHLLSNFNFQAREFEIRLLEAVKFLMLFRAIKLHERIRDNEDVPVFAMIMFARDSSPDPQQFMRKHLNAVGDTGGLEQVEMHLLGYTLGVTIKVVRPSHFGQSDFIASYPDDMPDGTPVVTMVAEDDRHYNILS